MRRSTASGWRRRADVDAFFAPPFLAPPPFFAGAAFLAPAVAFLAVALVLAAVRLVAVLLGGMVRRSPPAGAGNPRRHGAMRRDLLRCRPGRRWRPFGHHDRSSVSGAPAARLAGRCRPR